MSPVAVVPDLVGYAQSGDVVEFDTGTLVMGLSEVPDWDAGDLYITLMRDDGTLADPIRVTPGPTPYDVTLASSPGFTLVMDDGTRERPKFLLGPLEGSRELVKVQNISDGGLTEDGAQLFALVGLIDDERVHTADNDLLPGPGEIQDPVGLPDEGGPEPGESLLIPRLLDRVVFGQTTSGTSTDVIYARYKLGATGLLTTSERFGVTTTYSNEWMLYGEVESSQAALFEVRATIVSSDSIGSSETFTGPIDTWTQLGVDVEWALDYPTPASGSTARRLLFIEIREISTGIVLDSATIDLTVTVITEVGGA